MTPRELAWAFFFLGFAVILTLFGIAGMMLTLGTLWLLAFLSVTLFGLIGIEVGIAYIRRYR